MGSILGGLFGIGSGATQAAQQAASAGAQQSQNATGLEQWLMNLVGGDQSLFNNSYAPAIGAQGSALLQMLANPTVLHGLSDQAPGLQGFYGGEMAHGLDPTMVENLYSRNNQSATQGLNDILSRMGPGGNPAGAIRDNQNSLLSANTNLAGQLAGENQQVEERGAQGLMGLGQGLNTEATGTADLRSQIMQLLQGFTGQGLGMKQAGYGAIGGAADSAQRASQFDYGMSAQDSALANTQQQDFFNSIVSLGSAFLPGGQFASLFSGGSGGSLPGFFNASQNASNAYFGTGG